MAVTVASLQAVLDLDKRGFDRGIKTTETMMNRLANQGVQKGINALESGLRAMGDAVVDSVRQSAELEAQLSAVGAVSGATADEITDIKGLVKDLGIDPNLKVSSFEAADAIEMLARNGLAMSEIMDGAARSTVLLANSTGGEFSQAADIATDSMTLFNIAAKDMDQAVNGITSVVTNSKFDVNDYALALAQAGGVAASSGVDFNDFNTVIAGIAPLFASGSDAGTSFKTMLLKMANPTNKTMELMLQLGLATEESGSVFFDAAGNLKPMLEISGLLQNALGHLSEEQRSQALATMFGTDAMRAAVGLMDMEASGFAELSVAMSQTDAADAAALRMDNLAGSLEILDGVVETIKLQIGDGLNPAVREAADVSTELLSRLQEADSPVSRLGEAIQEDLIGPVIDLKAAFGDTNAELSTADFLMAGIGDTLDSFHGVLQGVGLGISFIGTSIEVVRDTLNWFDEKMGGIGINAGIVDQTLLNILDHILNMLNPFREITQAFQEGDLYLRAFGATWEWLGEKMSSPINIPDWLIPGSPTPFEMGLRGIGKAINDMPDLGQAVTVPAGAGTTNNFNFGGFAANVTTQGDGGTDQAIQMVLQMLRAEISR
jgi:TP901 family phage tail tape measure protein